MLKKLSKVVIFLMLIIINVYAKDNDLRIGVCKTSKYNCEQIAKVYKRYIDYRKILEKKGVTTNQRLMLLMYDDRFRNKIFLKALVLDYLYKVKNAEEFYSMSYETSDVFKKDLKGIYYSYYLARVGKVHEAIKLLRDIEIFGSKKLIPYPKVIASLVSIFNIDLDNHKNSNLKTYIKLRGLKKRIYN